MLSFVFLLCAAMAGLTQAASLHQRLEDFCIDPPAADNFTLDAVQGVWYEIGKVQTLGGAIPQRNCVCNQMNLTTLDYSNGDSWIEYNCNEFTPQGDVISVEFNLVDMTEPGKWTQQVAPLLPSVSWNVLVLGEDFIATYDCGSFITGNTEYCLHIASRTRTMSPEQQAALLQYSLDLGFNVFDRPYDVIDHEGCPPV